LTKTSTDLRTAITFSSKLLKAGMKSRSRDAVLECLGLVAVSWKFEVLVSSRRKTKDLGLVSVSGLNVSFYKLIFNERSSLNLVSVIG